jgi:dinuclear metal center YbgI/SA1388 family protein
MATMSGRAEPAPFRASQSGFNVATTNSSATATVTACEKISQSLRINDPTMAQRRDVQTYLDGLLDAGRFKDYGPNGLQVEGSPEVRRVVTGVTANLALIEAAVAAGADTVLVHHGLFWRGHDGRLTGWLRDRVARLLRHDVNLFAYHLPLDAHPEVGNNATLGARLGWIADERFGEQDLGHVATLAAPTSAAEIEAAVVRALAPFGRAPLCIEGDGRPIRRVAWCTGGAQGLFESAIAAGADLYLTGEISEPQAHLARETGVAFLAAGHHATERFGVQALGGRLAERFGLQHAFIDVDNPA